MSISRNLICTTLAVIVIGLGGAANGQLQDPGFTKLQPFGDWNFDQDLQLFAPTKTWEYGGEPIGANTGWFFSYDRMYMNFTRPSESTGPFQGDFTWGNRFEAGYMTDDDYGWLFSHTRVHGPNTELRGPNDEIGEGERVNFGRYYSTELNRTWRMEPFHNGGYLEPYIGARFIQFNDFTVGKVENNMVGGQFGLRYFKQKGSWFLSGQAVALPLQNFQFFQNESRDEFVIGGEARLEAAYLLTQSVAIRVGWDFNYFGQGVARNGNQPDNNDQDSVVTGVTFGVTVNR